MVFKSVILQPIVAIALFAAKISEKFYVAQQITFTLNTTLHVFGILSAILEVDLL